MKNKLNHKLKPAVAVGSSELLGHRLVITGDKKEWDECMAEIKSAAKLPNHIFRLVKRLAKPGRLRSSTARGAGVTVTLQPSDGLALLCAAIRTFKLNLLAVEHSAHNFNGGRWPNSRV